MAQRQNGIGAHGNGFEIVPVSPLERDDELHAPFSGLMMVPGYRPQVGQLCKNVRFDPRCQPQQDKFENWVLMDIVPGSPDATLIFSRQQLPSAALTPSDSHSDEDLWQWPPVLRGLDIRHIVSDGNYLDTLVVADIHDPDPLMSEHIYEEWWTTEKWPYELIRSNNHLPAEVRGDYPLARFNYKCLHGDTTLPPLTGITAILSRPVKVNQAHRPIIHFPRTNFVSWQDYTISDKQNKVRGRWYRVRHIVRPPYNPLKYPKLPEILSS